jgi:hypothetical protein
VVVLLRGSPLCSCNNLPRSSPPVCCSFFHSTLHQPAHTLPPPTLTPTPAYPTGSLVFLLVDLSLRACRTTNSDQRRFNPASTLRHHDGLSPVSKHHSQLILRAVWTKTLVLFLIHPELFPRSSRIYYAPYKQLAPIETVRDQPSKSALITIDDHSFVVFHVHSLPETRFLLSRSQLVCTPTTSNVCQNYATVSLAGIGRCLVLVRTRRVGLSCTKLS